MPLKIILLYDSSNKPLQVNGIRVELFNANSGKLLQAQNSADLNPGPAGQASNEWGVQLNFPAGSTPLDIYITDPLYRYPGNTVRYLNGRLQDRLYIDVLCLPNAAGGQLAPPASLQPADLSQWVIDGWEWNADEKEAVINLIFSYMSVVAARQSRIQESKPLADVAKNWEDALEKLGFPLDLFGSAPPASKSNPPSVQGGWNKVRIKPELTTSEGMNLY